MNLSTLISRVLTLFLLLAVGYIARRTAIIDETASKRLSKLIICIGQPFMIVSAQLDMEYSPENVRSGLIVMLISFCVLAVCSAIAYLCARPFKKMDENKVMQFTMIFSNCGFMGFPILESVFGATGLFYGAFFVVAFNITTWTWGMVILGRGRNDIRISPMKMIVNYGTLPSIIGFLLFALQVPVPDAAKDAVSYLGSLCTPISMLITGALIATQTVRELLLDARVYIVSFVKLIAMPLLIALLGALVGLDETMTLFMAVVSSLPSASNAVMFSETYDIEPQLSAKTVGVTTLLSTATIPLVLIASQWIFSLIR